MCVFACTYMYNLLLVIVTDTLGIAVLILKEYYGIEWEFSRSKILCRLDKA